MDGLTRGWTDEWMGGESIHLPAWRFKWWLSRHAACRSPHADCRVPHAACDATAGQGLRACMARERETGEGRGGRERGEGEGRGGGERGERGDGRRERGKGRGERGGGEGDMRGNGRCETIRRFCQGHLIRAAPSLSPSLSPSLRAPLARIGSRRSQARARQIPRPNSCAGPAPMMNTSIWIWTWMCI
jgi:hypothetical protein